MTPIRESRELDWEGKHMQPTKDTTAPSKWYATTEPLDCYDDIHREGITKFPPREIDAQRGGRWATEEDFVVSWGDTYSGHNPGSIAPSKADLRLIMAAPELLAACKAAAKELLQFEINNGAYSSPALTLLNAAIVKAEGAQ